MTTMQKKLAKTLRNWYELKDWTFQNKYYFYQAMTTRIKRFLEEEYLYSDFEYIDIAEDKIIIESLEDSDIFVKDFRKWEEYFKRKLPEFIAKAVLPETGIDIFDKDEFDKLSDEDIIELYNSIDEWLDEDSLEDALEEAEYIIEEKDEIIKNLQDRLVMQEKIINKLI